MTDYSMYEEDDIPPRPAETNSNPGSSVNLIPLTNRVQAVENDLIEIKRGMIRLENQIKSIYRSLVNINSALENVEAALDDKISIPGSDF